MTNHRTASRIVLLGLATAILALGFSYLSAIANTTPAYAMSGPAKSTTCKVIALDVAHATGDYTMTASSGTVAYSPDGTWSKRIDSRRWVVFGYSAEEDGIIYNARPCMRLLPTYL